MQAPKWAEFGVTTGPAQRDDEDAPARAIIALVSQYGRLLFVLEMLDCMRSWHRGLFHAVKLSV